jgi:ribosome-binding ATPase
MKAGLVGYAQTGKTTLFNALTGLGVQTGAAGRGQKANLGVIKVPDERIDKLSAIFKPRKTIYAEIVFVDVPGPRTKGGGLDSATIQALREADALALVIRGFDGFEQEKPDPVRELADFEAELILNDQIVVERRLERLAKERGHEREQAVLELCLAELNAGRSLQKLMLAPEQEREIASYAFLSRRPMLAVLNVQESALGEPMNPQLQHTAQQRDLQLVSICAEVEAEIAALPREEQQEFLAGMGISEPAAARFIRSTYRLLDYISFFTVGEDEVRAWNLHRGEKAPRAAGRVHTDIERGFIRAEVMKYNEFIEVGSEARMKEIGKLHVEGKDYLVEDGDILHFRFNV